MGELLEVDAGGDGEKEVDVAWASFLVGNLTGSAIDIEWDMRPRSRAMQMAAVLARPLLRWSHEWVLARGLDQFRQRALTNSDDERSERDQ